VSGVSDAIQVAVGGSFSCALRSGGTVRCWGSDTFGALGNGSTTGTQYTPTAVEGLTGVTQISAHGYAGCARLSNGTAQCWGHNSDGQSGDGTTVQSRPAPVAVAGLTNVVQVVTGGQHACALLANGTVRCWGNNGSGRLGDGTEDDRLAPVVVTGLTGIAQLDADGTRTCARSASGYAWCWGGTFLGHGVSGESAVPVAVIN
jgi:alpha-tubulin suppressor-like RCC1 family protein